WLDIGRYDERRHTGTVLLERIDLDPGELGAARVRHGCGRRRRHMVVASAVLVIGDDQQDLRPCRAATDRGPYLVQELFTPAHRTVPAGVLVVGPYHKLGLYYDIGWQLV